MFTVSSESEIENNYIACIPAQIKLIEGKTITAGLVITDNVSLEIYKIRLEDIFNDYGFITHK